ncbi:MAG: hypothetical protein Q9212_006939 [Teloschistes hypoglaucus]
MQREPGKTNNGYRKPMNSDKYLQYQDVVPPGPSLVPYVCQEEYDGGPFLKYLHRKGKEDLLDDLLETDRSGLYWVTMPPVSEFQALIQTWLFFGLLNEILGTLFTPSRYVRTMKSRNKPSRIVDTSDLLLAFHAWVKDVQQSEHTEIQKRTQYEHIAACLQLTRDVMEVISCNSQLMPNRLIRLSVVSVAELLVDAAERAYGTNTSTNLHWVTIYRDPATFSQMRKHGFCPTEIKRIEHTFSSIQSYHCLMWMRRADQVNRHNQCTECECRPSHTNTIQYDTKHVDDICRCSSYSVEVSEIVDILSNGSLPLLKITQATPLSDIKLEVIEATPNSDYVAYSHVWSDGLGNPYANSLPKCQLKRLHELTRQFLPCSERGENSRGLPIWIDTLCCPVGPPAAKSLAIHSMKVPYTEAPHVLVLDSSLEHIESSELHLTEIGIRIFTSGWMRRLWTLQEGALPQKLWFQFKDKAVDLDQVRDAALHCDDLERRMMSDDILDLHEGLRGWFHKLKPGKKPDLVSIHESLQFRSVSVSTDEPLLVGGLLNLDLGYILDGDESSRMQRLYKTAPRFTGFFEATRALLVHGASGESGKRQGGQVISDEVLQVQPEHGAKGTLLEMSYQHSQASLTRSSMVDLSGLGANDGITGGGMYEAFINMTFLGRYFELGEMFSSSTEWCID